VDKAAALAELNKEIEACRRCDLYRTATRVVPGEGPADATIMFVGEAPGFNEDRQGRPFVGAAGKFLDQELLPAAGLSRAEVFITNIVKHRPPENRDPAPDELTACRSWLERQLEIIDPKLIVTLGRYPMRYFFPDVTISRVHGQMRKKDGRHVFFMYHPAAALHQQALRDTLLADMKSLGEFIRGPLTREGEELPANDEEGAPKQLGLF
jgi:DNA polymerase